MRPFLLERYFAEYEFSSPYLLCSSDMEPLGLGELLDHSDEKSLRMWEQLSLGYTESKGHPMLLEEISGLYDDISPKEILTVVPEEGIYLFMRTYLRSGDEVVATWPGYQSLTEIAAEAGASVTHWEPEADGFSIETLERLLSPATRHLIINFPHNPTGFSISREEQQKIISLAQEHEITIFSDEMYRGLEYDEKDRLPAFSEIYDDAVSLSGMSKSFSLAGLRIGWITSNNREIMDGCAAYKDYTSICCSAPSEILAIMGLRAKTWIQMRNRRLMDDNLRLLDEFFSTYQDQFVWNFPDAGPIAFPAVKDMDADAFCQDLIGKKGVLLLPSTCYEYGNRNFRISAARKNMPEALERLYEYMREDY